jgi:hypothetical protein
MDINYIQLNEHVPIEELYNEDFFVLHNILFYSLVDQYDNHCEIICDYLEANKLLLISRYDILYELISHICVSMLGNKDLNNDLRKIKKIFV